MPVRNDERATEVTEIDRFPGGVGWMAHPEETMRRASHAVATDAGVYVVDPVDADGVDDLLAAYGPVAGVVTLSNWHERDAAAVADRHDVPVYVPADAPGLAPDAAVPVEAVSGRLPGSDYRFERVTRLPGFREYALTDGATLLVADSLGTIPSFLVGDERIGVWAGLRLVPPTALAAHSPERVLVGHGEGVFEDATAALRDAIENARRRAPRALVENGTTVVRTATTAALR